MKTFGRSRFTALSKGLRRKRGEMNRTETAYAEHLDALKLAGEIADYWFEPMSIRLSHPPGGSKEQPARVTPDFLVLLPDGETCLDDVKGGGKGDHDDRASGVRMKCAAEQFPLWRFRIVRQRRKKDGGGFDIREV